MEEVKSLDSKGGKKLRILESITFHTQEGKIEKGGRKIHVYLKAIGMKNKQMKLSKSL